MRGKRQKIQYSVALEPMGQGETPVSGYQGTEPFVAKPTSESPASAEQLMEEVCERENLVRAWKRVRRNQGSPGVGGMTIAAAEAGVRVTGRSLGDRARVLLIGDHENDDLRGLVRARASGHGVDCGWRLVERLARVQDAAGLAVDGELVSALDHVAECVMARMPVRRAAAPRRAIEQRDADLATRQIGERLDEERLQGGRRGLGR